MRFGELESLLFEGGPDKARVRLDELEEEFRIFNVSITFGIGTCYGRPSVVDLVFLDCCEFNGRRQILLVQFLEQLQQLVHCSKPFIQTLQLRRVLKSSLLIHHWGCPYPTQYLILLPGIPI